MSEKPYRNLFNDARRLLMGRTRSIILLVLVAWSLLHFVFVEPSLRRGHVIGGLPTPVDSSTFVWTLRNRGYLVGYSQQRRNPLWVAYRLRGTNDPNHEERPSRFDSDWRMVHSVSHDDYTGSGYDRGHMAPNYAIATRFGRKAQLETFLMTNICPQTPSLNRGPWRMLEERVAKKYANNFGEVWVITGPIFNRQIARLKSGVEVPDAFYKIIVDQTENAGIRTIAFIMPQLVRGTESPDQFVTTIDHVESLTGLDFLAELDDPIEVAVEAAGPDLQWRTPGGTAVSSMWSPPPFQLTGYRGQ